MLDMWTLLFDYQCARSIEVKFSCNTTQKFYNSERIIVFQREMSWRTRGEMSSFDRLHWISNALKDLSGVVRETSSDTKSEDREGEGQKWQVPTIRCRRLCGRANYVIKWLVERFASWNVPRVHIAISIHPPNHPHPLAIALHIPTHPILRRFRESCHRSAAFYSHR